MSPLLARSNHVVYTNVVEALLRFVLVNKGYMLLHSATVRLGEETIMLSAQTDTGKTGTILRLLQEHPDKSAFLSDDMTIINREGEARSFPKPLTISSHTMRAVNKNVLKPSSPAGPRFPESDPFQGGPTVRVAAGQAEHSDHCNQRDHTNPGPATEVHDQPAGTNGPLR